MKDELPERTLIAHNAPFDMMILKNEGLPAPKFFIDTLKVARKYYDLSTYTLNYLRYYFDVRLANVTQHDAFQDVRILIEIFNKMAADICFREKLTMDQTLDRMVNVSMNMVMLHRIPFGKYKGMLFDEAMQDAGAKDWCQWLYKNGKDLSPDLIFTLESCLKSQSSLL